MDSPILEMLGVEKSFPGVFTDISFELKRSEILGFAGLVGAGRSEVMEAILGMRPVTDAIKGRQNGYNPRSSFFVS